MDKKKITFIILAILVLLSIPLALTIPTVNKLSQCYQESTQILTLETERMLEEGTPQKRDLCSTGQRITKDLESCIQDVENSSVVPVSFVYKMSNLLSKEPYNPQTSVDKHNQLCKEYPEYQIK